MSNLKFWESHIFESYKININIMCLYTKYSTDVGYLNLI